MTDELSMYGLYNGVLWTFVIGLLFLNVKDVAIHYIIFGLVVLLLSGGYCTFYDDCRGLLGVYSYRIINMVT